MSRIGETFSKLQLQDKTALIPFITAGDPQPEYTVPLMHELVTAGASIIELGVPFSDPMADGPVIQAAQGKGALVVAGDKLLIMSSRGDYVVAEATPEEFRELRRETIMWGGVYWTTPVLCGGLAYCRNSMGDLVCIDHRSGTK